MNGLLIAMIVLNCVQLIVWLSSAGIIVYDVIAKHKTLTDAPAEDIMPETAEPVTLTFHPSIAPSGINGSSTIMDRRCPRVQNLVDEDIII